MKTYRSFVFLVLALTASTSMATSIYTRDHKYIYIKTPVVLTLDQQQQEAIKKATARIVAQLDSLDAQNPRLTPVQKMDDKLIKNADAFEKSIDQVLAFTQKYYGNQVQYGFHFYNVLPSAFIAFGGVEVTANLGISAGGAVMMGFIFVPQRVQVMEIDTHKIVSDSISMDTALVVFPTANAGVGVGGGANGRIGAGIIFGELNSASEFKGLLTGASASFALGVGNNFKVQTLKNWGKSGAINNIVITAAWENGLTAKLDAHATVSYVVDAQSFFNSIGGITSGLVEKLGLNIDPSTSTTE